MKKLFKKLFWNKVYQYRISRGIVLKANERITSISMAYHNSYPAGMQTIYLFESVKYEKPVKKRRSNFDKLKASLKSFH